MMAFFHVEDSIGRFLNTNDPSGTLGDALRRRVRSSDLHRLPSVGSLANHRAKRVKASAEAERVVPHIPLVLGR